MKQTTYPVGALLSAGDVSTNESRSQVEDYRTIGLFRDLRTEADPVGGMSSHQRGRNSFKKKRIKC